MRPSHSGSEQDIHKKDMERKIVEEEMNISDRLSDEARCSK